MTNTSHHDRTIGVICEDAFGFHIRTPHGWWDLSTEEALALNADISAMLQLRLTRPWGNDDKSTIITRGRRVHLEGLNYE